MKYIRLLKNKTIAILWLSQLLSATGDQIYLVCACWLAAQISPASIAIVAASEYLSAFCFSFLAGVLADRYNKRNLMLCSDLGRAVAVFSLPIASIFHPISIWHLAIVGICLGALGVLFDPCMIVTIPALADEQWLLQATNGLTDFTKRMARALGPALAGLLATVIPIQYLFNLDALSFLISAVGVVYIYSQINKDQEEIVIKSTQSKSYLSDLHRGWTLIKKHMLIRWELVCYFFANFAYAIVYTAGLPLLTRQKFGDNFAAYGLLISIYGGASVIANIVMGNKKIRNPGLTIFIAYTLWGIDLCCPLWHQI